MKEQDETPLMEANAHSKSFLKKAVSDTSSVKKGKSKSQQSNSMKRYGGK